MMLSRWIAPGMALMALACSKTESTNHVGPAPEPLPTTTASTTSSGTSAPAQPPKPPTLAPVPLKLTDMKEEAQLHTIDGAVLVTSHQHVGRLLKDRVEWIGQIKKSSPATGDNRIQRAFGQWPEEVVVVYMTSEGRAPEPTYFPIKGGGGWFTFAPGGGLGWIAGHARSGETTTIAGYDLIEGHRVVKVRGPMVKPKLTPGEKLGCEGFPEDDFRSRWLEPAVKPSVYGSTRAGTILSVGDHCKDEKPAVEIWRKPTEASEIVKLGQWWPDTNMWMTEILRGPGDTAYLVGSGQLPLLRYRDGKVAPLPKLQHARQDAFVSPEGVLFATDERRVFELVGDRWEQRFELKWSLPFMTLVRFDERFLLNRFGQVFELKPTKSIELDPTATAVDCKTPFVHLFDVTGETKKGFGFPETAKRLSTFEHLDRVKLVDFHQEGRRIGIVADDWEAAKAAWQHARNTKPEEDARLICFAPVEPRAVKVKAAPGPTAASGSAKPAASAAAKASSQPRPSSPPAPKP